MHHNSNFEILFHKGMPSAKHGYRSLPCEDREATFPHRTASDSQGQWTLDNQVMQHCQKWYLPQVWQKRELIYRSIGQDHNFKGFLFPYKMNDRELVGN